MEHSIPKGTFDLIPEDLQNAPLWRNTNRWHYVESIMKQTASEYGFQEIRTPIFERTELFQRGIGDETDIVSKEMYTFEDKGGRSLTLRPEGTASVMRSYIENNLSQSSSLRKLYYTGPMFRYERPQAGRFRQHHQFGVESIGTPLPQHDAETIDLLCEIYRRLGLKNLTVMLNTVGDSSSRNHYKEALKNYLSRHLEALSPDSQTRFHKNILRILDSKDPQDQAILSEAPSLLDHLNKEAKSRFERVKECLDEISVNYIVNPKLVRGLDYYNHTVFEITSSELGAQNTLGGGGRYDGLIASLGGPDLAGIGFATGIERVIHTMTEQNCTFPPFPHPFIYLIPVGEKAEEWLFKLSFDLRHAKIPTEIEFQTAKIQKSIKQANALAATYMLVIGDTEIGEGKAELKHLATRTSSEIALDSLVPTLKSLYDKQLLTCV